MGLRPKPPAALVVPVLQLVLRVHPQERAANSTAVRSAQNPSNAP